MKVSKKKELGDFLRNKRDSTLPKQSNVVKVGIRRAKGLRREEVAELAGVGVSWYTWLEQGRAIQVSHSLLSSILVALRCTAAETKYALELAGYSSADNTSLKEEVPIYQLEYILDAMKRLPAIVLDSRWNILKFNEMALYIYNANNNLKYNNLIELIFLDENYQMLFPNWMDKAVMLLSQFRLTFSKNLGDKSMVEFVESMKQRSSFFCECWVRHKVMDETPAGKIILHPILKELSFDFSSLHYVGKNSESFRLFINTPTKGSTTEEKLRDIKL